MNLFKNKYRILSSRHPNHDYNAGVYFITICTHHQKRYFGEVIGDDICLTDIGKYTQEAIQKIGELHPDVEVWASVIMPNHVHLVLSVEVSEVVETSYYGVYNGTISDNETPQCDVSTMMSDTANKCGRLSYLISAFKSSVTRYARQRRILFAWQTRFHDRIIRNSHEYEMIYNYVLSNVANWHNDCFYADDSETPQCDSLYK